MVSIIIPVFNVEFFLEECLSSILNSTYKNIEIILINNGSTDNSLNICKKYANLDNRIILINKEVKIGVSNARNIGIKKAKGKYIIFIDSDDIIHPNMIEYLRIAAEDADIAICNFISFYNNIKIKYYNSFNIEKVNLKIKLLYETKYFVPWNKIFKKELFYDISFPSNQTSEEEYTIYKVLLKAKNIVHIDNILYYYRIRKESITDIESTLRAKDIVACAYDKIEYFSKYNDGFYYKEALILTLNRLFHIRDSLYLKKYFKMCKYIDLHIERIGKLL